MKDMYSLFDKAMPLHIKDRGTGISPSKEMDSLICSPIYLFMNNSYIFNSYLHKGDSSKLANCYFVLCREDHIEYYKSLDFITLRKIISIIAELINVKNPDRKEFLRGSLINKNYDSVEIVDYDLENKYINPYDLIHSSDSLDVISNNNGSSYVKILSKLESINY